MCSAGPAMRERKRRVNGGPGDLLRVSSRRWAGGEHCWQDKVARKALPSLRPVCVVPLSEKTPNLSSHRSTVQQV